MMDYMTLFKEKHIKDNSEYPHNDIGIAKLFYDVHRGDIRYVPEAKTWYSYNGKRWEKDEGGLSIMERCKCFVQSLAEYAKSLDDGSEGGKAFVKYATGFHARRKREGLLSDARSIAPKLSMTLKNTPKISNQFNHKSASLLIRNGREAICFVAQYIKTFKHEKSDI